MTNVHRCPVRACESLILPARTVCHGHLMSLPAAVRDELSRLQEFIPGSYEHQAAQAKAVGWLDRRGDGRRGS